MGEQAKVAIRNSRRDANKHLDKAGKDKSEHISEDEIEGRKSDIDDLTKKHEKTIEELISSKITEVEEI